MLVCIFLNLSNHCHICLNWGGWAFFVFSCWFGCLSSFVRPISNPAFSGSYGTIRHNSSRFKSKTIPPPQYFCGFTEMQDLFHACDVRTFSSYIISSNSEDHPTAETPSPLSKQQGLDGNFRRAIAFTITLIPPYCPALNKSMRLKTPRSLRRPLECPTMVIEY